MKINTISQLEQEMTKRIKVAIEELTKKIYKKLMDFIQEDVYGTYPGSDAERKYERTNEFKNKAWDSYVYDFSGEIAGFIAYNPQAMTYNPDKYQHGNKTEDRREELAEILNRGNWNWDKWDFGRPKKDNQISVYPKPFWDDTIEYITENWNKLVKEAFSEAGLKIK